MVMSRKLMLLLVSSSSVKFSLGVRLLNLVIISCVLVKLCL
jgi:hypothetical protein